MPTAEFDLPAGHQPMDPGPVTPFPEAGAPEEEVLDGVAARLEVNRYRQARNFAITYSGLPHPIASRVEALMPGTFFVEWATGTEAGTWSMEREAIRMMASLLGNPDATGFLTSGGTESNLAAMRLMRNTGRRERPRIVVPVTMHFSFRLGAELMGIELDEIPVDGDTFQPRLEDIEGAITPDTVGLVVSSPGGSFGVMDPIEAVADLGWRKGLPVHVDAAFGGFILPFMRDLGHPVPPFDLAVKGVTTIMTDGHKLGLLPTSTGFFLANDPAMIESVPTERTLIHTTSSTKPGSRAAAAWATFRHLGRQGYRDSTAHVLRIRDLIVDGVTAVPGMRTLVPPFITVVAFTSDTVDLARVHARMAEDGWGQSHGAIRGRPYLRLSIHPSRDEEHARGFVHAFQAAVRAG